MFQGQAIHRYGLAIVVLIPLLAGSASGQITFAPRTTHATCESAWSIDSGDFNHDGFPDIAVSGWTNGEVSVHLNDQTGAFGAGSTFPADLYATGIAATDLDNDGWDDIATCHHDRNTVAVLINNQDGTFAPPVTYPVGSRTWNVEAGDLNADGWIDLVAANVTSDDISVLINNQDGTFAAAVSYQAESSPMDSAIADLNGDGSPDIAVANYSWNSICVLFNNGDGTFQPRRKWGVGEGTRGIIAVDLDRDSDIDLATADSYSYEYTLLMNDGNGLFPSRITTWLGVSDFQIASSDLDLDGDPDLLFADYFAGVAVLKNRGDGSFGQPVKFDTISSGSTNDIVVADFDKDGRDDFAVSNMSDNSFSVGLNTTAFPPVLTQDPLIRGQSSTMTVTGVDPYENVFFAYTLSGVAPDGFCTPLLGGMCMDLVAPVHLVGSSTADGSGTAWITRLIPGNVPLITVWTQAVIQRGISHVNSVKSNYVEDQIQ